MIHRRRNSETTRIRATGGEHLLVADCPARADCRGSIDFPYIQIAVQLGDSSHDGETVTYRIDGRNYAVTVDGRLAPLQLHGVTPGAHEVVLTDPAQCTPPEVVVCE